MGLNDMVDAASLRSRFPAPKQEKGPSDLRGSLGVSFDYVASMKDVDMGDENRLVFHLPLSPYGLNQRVHWSQRQKLNRQYREFFEALQFKRVLPRPPNEPWFHGILTATFYTRGENDIDNLMGRAKVSIDCLVRGGYLAGDSPAHLTWGAIPQQVVDRATPAYLVLEVRRE